ncbi:Protein bfr2 [Neolecta irregularis DAH-3]|uniref:Protein BFR2 n=1 Tax=Neolecta irregularis (strain DAH-3) TaxID=1198029 RepID=A0A1U7LS64_NEOID|nr:Protein bfr2 [Neolecta irregularis DAH-3]|eukprot:OLL25423.1 Protein bfr2 [Neolecta irregularis DAH-3]
MSSCFLDLTNPKPEVDPEAGPFACSDSEDNDSSQDFEIGREHYADVSQSQMRTDADDLLGDDATYQGTRASRHNIYGDIEKIASGSEGISESDDSDDRKTLEQMTDSIANDDGDSSETDSDEASGDDTRKKEYQKLLAQDKEANDQKIQEQVVDDCEKGKQIKSQMAFYNSLLDVRIKLQKALVASDNFVQMGRELSDASHITAVETSTVSLINSIFDIRDRHLSNALEEQGLKPSLKRLRANSHDVTSKEIWEAIEHSSQEHASWKEHTLSKWSRKVVANAPPSINKFKSLNQDSLSQIRENLTDNDRLIQRTRVKRTKIDSMEKHISTFDDTDFYQSLLKDLIDRKMLDSSDINANLIKKEKNVAVDTKASKGRKLRYHVHEKLLNFMAPTPSGLWHDGQTDELFSSLFGKKVEVEKIEIEKMKPEMACLRLFA